MKYNHFPDVARDKSFWLNMPKPIIGLAPMDGYSDSAFRHVCKMVNPNIVTFTEFTSADGIHFGAKRLKEKLYFHPEEQPVFAQIFGKNRSTYITAAKFVEDMGFSGVDINMGCPSKKVVRSEHGVALRKKPDLAFELVQAVAEAVSIPVSVKTRLGWSDASDLIPFSQGIEQAGANMICIHARTYKEPYNVPAEWHYLYELKKHINIPVLGNGGIESYHDAIDKIQNLDGCLIGQATFGNPWVFVPSGKPKRLSDRMPVIRQHAQWLVDHKGTNVGCLQIRKHLLSYTKGFHGAKIYRTRLQRVTSLDEIYSILDELESLSI